MRPLGAEVPSRTAVVRVVSRHVIVGIAEGGRSEQPLRIRWISRDGTARVIGHRECRADVDGLTHLDAGLACGGRQLQFWPAGSIRCADIPEDPDTNGAATRTLAKCRLLKVILYRAKDKRKTFDDLSAVCGWTLCCMT